MTSSTTSTSFTTSFTTSTTCSSSGATPPPQVPHLLLLGLLLPRGLLRGGARHQGWLRLQRGLWQDGLLLLLLRAQDGQGAHSLLVGLLCPTLGIGELCLESFFEEERNIVFLWIVFVWCFLFLFPLHTDRRLDSKSQRGMRVFEGLWDREIFLHLKFSQGI